MIDVSRWVRPAIAKLTPYSSARDEFAGDADVYLDANESPFGDYNRYPDPMQKLLKEQLAVQRGVSENQIVVGNGSDEIIDLIFRTFCEPRTDVVAAISPSYGMYAVTAAIHDVKLIELPLNTEFDIDESTLDLIQSEDRIKAVFMCSPNNPTGNLLSSKWMERILNTNLLVVIDEAYIDFANENSWISRLDEFENLIVLQTLSKAWGLANARVGLAFTSPVIADWMNRVKPPYNVSGLNQEAAIHALQNPTQQRERVARIKSEKTRVEQSLAALGSVVKIYPSQANFILVEFNNAQEIFKHLMAEKVIVRDRSSLVKNTLRITIGSQEENTRLIETLQKLES
ncbi:histidinol-phosphate transaminase [Phaeocystidibacter marisrubri]|uniref:Histidinol-phosphate aminotransferase n=1 Tax=Phaeocystidibacter marisrubri TaxID=1577780 RepID=A0A6L3ZE68_9FLAO|nr:histidinol-phosphate transaminase [Phaeocystidibacter marisrubri]KAB2815747.1 histidinol-phosphate transaminase [Phaeocystidibacter marisrubri]GGH65503.1 histidinol-phosphate aminotransferase [Phaeocystidibacter marisrubri]